MSEVPLYGGGWQRLVLSFARFDLARRVDLVNLTLGSELTYSRFGSYAMFRVSQQ